MEVRRCISLVLFACCVFSCGKDDDKKKNATEPEQAEESAEEEDFPEDEESSSSKSDAGGSYDPCRHFFYVGPVKKTLRDGVFAMFSVIFPRNGALVAMGASVFVNVSQVGQRNAFLIELMDF